ncbi:tetratricopeptide repeat protein [Sorangium sp. So ce269]
MALLRLKRLGAALIEAQTARRLSPEAPLTHLVLGRVMFAHRRPSEAREHVATARGLAPSDPAPLRGLAAVKRYPDRDDRAVELLTQALELAPEDAETLVALANAHLARGRVDDAER